MTLSMYQASVPVFVHQLTALSKFLAKGAEFAAEKGIDPATLIATRLAPDMASLERQVQIATDGCKGGVARLAGVAVPSYADDEKTFDELQARIARTIAFLQTITPEQVDGSEDKQIDLKFGPNEFSFKGQAFLLTFVLPNFFFHVTTAYGLLRHAGVQIGKRDFLGG